MHELGLNSTLKETRAGRGHLFVQLELFRVRDVEFRLTINRARRQRFCALPNLGMESGNNTEHCKYGGILNGIPTKIREPACKKVHPNKADSHDNEAPFKAEIGGQIVQHASATPPHSIQNRKEYHQGGNACF